MKSSLRFIAVLSIVLVYFFAISIYSSNTFSPSVFFSPLKTSENQLHKSEVSPKLFCHTAPTENSVFAGSHIPVPSLKNSLSGFAACANATEKLFFSAISQYNFYVQNLLIRLKQTDFIYPFHHFW